MSPAQLKMNEVVKVRCAGCDEEIEYIYRGQLRKWHSDACRKRTLYSRPCPNCGRSMNGSDGRGPSAPERCIDCARVDPALLAVASERERAKGAPRRRVIELMWRDGASHREIATALSTTIASLKVTIHRMRQDGVDLPYRWHRREPSSA